MKRSESEVHDCGADVAAYSLGALDEHEADRFAEHLRECAICRDELLAFHAVVDVLAMAAPAMAPRRAVKRNLMAAIAADQRALAPRKPSGWWTLLPSPRAGMALAAVLAAVLIGGGVALVNSGAPATRVLSAQVVGQSGTAQVRLTGDRAELIVDHFAQPPAGHIYEVWLVRRGKRPLSPTNALFSTRAGRADVDVPGSMRGVSGVLVTPEPAGGSQVPHHTPVIRAQFS